MTRSTRDRRRVVIALALALLLHATVGVIVQLLWREAPVETPQPLVVRLLSPPKPSAPEPRPEPVTERVNQPTVTQPSSDPEPAREPNPKESTAQTTPQPPSTILAPEAPTGIPIDQRGPRRVELFPAETLAELAEPAPPLEGHDLARARLRQWDQTIAERQRATHLTVALKELGTRMEQWFLPPDHAIEQAAPLGLGVASALVPWHDFIMQGTPTSDAQAFLRDPDINPNGRQEKHPAIPFVLCFGFCDDRGNEIASLEVLIDVEHDAAGLPERWAVARSSGHAGFDQTALEAVRDATSFAPEDVLTGDPPAIRSRWGFAAMAFRHGRAALILDPLFTPPGIEMEEHSGLLGKTQVVRRVRLVALRLREP